MKKISESNKDLFGKEVNESLTLADKYLLAPTSVLNTRALKAVN